MNKKSNLSFENKLTTYKAILKPVWTFASSYGDAANLATQKYYKRFNQISKDDKRCPLVHLKSNIASRLQNSVCTRRNHTPCQQAQTTHHWPQQPANNQS
jgi:hypothetical protein